MVSTVPVTIVAFSNGVLDMAHLSFDLNANDSGGGLLKALHPVNEALQLVIGYL
jgi:hypothetical protein